MAGWARQIPQLLQNRENGQPNDVGTWGEVLRRFPANVNGQTWGVRAGSWLRAALPAGL